MLPRPHRYYDEFLKTCRYRGDFFKKEEQLLADANSWMTSID
jgi:hypothetical protein